MDHEAEGTHVTLGGELARKYHESPDVIHAILAHHNDVEPQTVEAVLVQAADAISAARPGARRESLENYIKRLEKLEEIANSFDGVEKCYAIQSGREVRIMVKPDDVTDEGTKILAKEIAKRIEKEMEYPGTDPRERDPRNPQHGVCQVISGKKFTPRFELRSAAFFCADV